MTRRFGESSRMRADIKPATIASGFATSNVSIIVEKVQTLTVEMLEKRKLGMHLRLEVLPLVLLTNTDLQIVFLVHMFKSMPQLLGLLFIAPRWQHALQDAIESNFIIQRWWRQGTSLTRQGFDFEFIKKRRQLSRSVNQRLCRSHMRAKTPNVML